MSARKFTRRQAIAAGAGAMAMDDIVKAIGRIHDNADQLV